MTQIKLLVYRCVILAMAILLQLIACLSTVSISSGSDLDGTLWQHTSGFHTGFYKGFYFTETEDGEMSDFYGQVKYIASDKVFFVWTNPIFFYVYLLGYTSVGSYSIESGTLIENTCIVQYDFPQFFFAEKYSLVETNWVPPNWLP
jgi:hypothetical protein